MHVWKYKPDILDPPDCEEEDRAILQYLRYGGILFGDRIGEIEGFMPATKPYRKPPEPEPEPPKPEEVYGPFQPEYYFSRCIQCNRSITFDPSKESVCSTQCRDTLQRYREDLLERFGMK
jgi:hypothetical protein